MSISSGGSALVSLSVLDSAEHLLGFNVGVGYDTTLLDVSDGDVIMGQLFTSAGGWTMFSNVNDAAGSILMVFFRSTEMSAGTGSIADINFHVPLSAHSALTPLDVNGIDGEGTGRFA